jgi:hypothetical protein
MKVFPYNHSCLFLLPILHLKASGLGVGGQLFKNTYIGVDIEPELNNHFFLHYKYSPKKEFLQLEAGLMERRNFVKDIHAGDDILYCFSVPENYKEEYKLFKEGKYSQFSNTYKMQVLRCYELGYEDPLRGLYIVKEENHRIDFCNLLFPVLNKLEPLKEVIEYNLSNWTEELYFRSTSTKTLSRVDLGDQELFSLPTENEVYKLEKVRYKKTKIELNKNFENE